MARRFEEINSSEKEVQLGLFASEEVKKYNWPEWRRGDRYVQLLIDEPSPYLGLDLEFDPAKDRVTIVGLSDRKLSASTAYNPEIFEELVYLCKNEGVKLVGFSVNGAEKTQMEKALGKKLPIDYFEDTMLLFYLHYQHLTKTSGGKADYEKGALGFINLWTCASLLTDLPMWKLCRELGCSGNEPCPWHNVWGYNAIDAYAGIESFEVLKKRTPDNLWKLYREIMILSEIAQKMQDNGVNIDRDLVKKLDKVTDEEKLELFPYEMEGKKKKFQYFNPGSPTEALAYFKKQKIKLASFNKTDLVNYIKKLAKKKNIDYDEYVIDKDLSDVEKLLVNSALYKGAGKGFKAWFADRYFGKDGYLHPRFITTGTSSGRWSSSKPNFQNLPSYDEDNPEKNNSFDQARMCIIPKKKENVFIKYDKSQLELRCCLYLAGVDVREVSGDAFQWLVDKAPGAFKEASDMVGRNERFIAKSVGHASNYLEGIVLLDEQDLANKKKQEEIASGSLRLYEDWKFYGKYVCFSGVNLAQRLFGEATEETRKKAHAIQEDIYFKEFSILRKLHRKILKEIEETQMVKLPTGRFLKLYSSDVESAKIGMAFMGQGLGAEHVQSGMLRFYEVHGEEGVPTLQIHDELDFEKPRSWSNEECIKFMSIAEEIDFRLPNFYCPIKMYRGENLAQMERIK